jgi:hypothetical protein
LNKKRALRFLRYFLMMFVSLNFVTTIIILSLNPGIIISLLVLFVMSAIAVVIAARDVSYIRWF